MLSTFICCTLFFFKERFIYIYIWYILFVFISRGQRGQGTLSIFRNITTHCSRPFVRSHQSSPSGQAAVVCLFYFCIQHHRSIIAAPRTAASIASNNVDILMLKERTHTRGERSKAKNKTDPVTQFPRFPSTTFSCSPRPLFYLRRADAAMRSLKLDFCLLSSMQAPRRKYPFH